MLSTPRDEETKARMRDAAEMLVRMTRFTGRTPTEALLQLATALAVIATECGFSRDEVDQTVRDTLNDFYTVNKLMGNATS